MGDRHPVNSQTISRTKKANSLEGKLTNRYLFDYCYFHVFTPPFISLALRGDKYIDFISFNRTTNITSNRISIAFYMYFRPKLDNIWIDGNYF